MKYTFITVTSIVTGTLGSAIPPTYSTVSAATPSQSNHVYVPVQLKYGQEKMTSEIVFGTHNSTPIKVVMDLGSGSSWVWGPGSEVNYNPEDRGNFGVGRCNQSTPYFYDPKKDNNKSYKKGESAFAYGGNAKIVQGDAFYNISLSFPSASGSVKNVQFALENYGHVSQQTGDTCEPIDVDNGIIGLSPISSGVNTSPPHFRQDLFDQGVIKSKSISVWMNKAPADIKATITGGVLLGGIDKSKYTGTLTPVKNVNDGTQVGYYVTSPSISSSGKKVKATGAKTCLLDSGSLQDTLPLDFDKPEEQASFLSATGIKNDDGPFYYPGACNNIPFNKTIDYTFPGSKLGSSVTIKVPLRNYAKGNLQYDGFKTKCYLNIDSIGCTFGAPFFTAAFLAANDDVNYLALAQGGVAPSNAGLGTVVDIAKNAVPK